VSEYPAGQLTRGGEKFDLRVDDDGKWLTTALGRELRYPDRAKLVAEIDRLLRLEKKAVHIPFTRVERKSGGYLSILHGVVTGIHSGTGNLLVSWDKGGNGQITVGHSTEIMRRLLSEEEEELTRLAREDAESTAALRDFYSGKQVYKGTRGLADQVEILLKEGKK
jgi:hypothetical protein